MKLLVIPLVFMACIVNAQFVVTNPAADVSNMKRLVEASKQTAEAVRQTQIMKEELDHMKEARNVVKKVNRHLKTIYYLEEMVRITKNTVESSERGLKTIKGTEAFTQQELNIIVNNYGRIVMAGNSVMSLGNMIIKDNEFEMNDFERLEKLESWHRDLLALNTELNILQGRYLHMAEKRALIKAFEGT